MQEQHHPAGARTLDHGFAPTCKARAFGSHATGGAPLKAILMRSFPKTSKVALPVSETLASVQLRALLIAPPPGAF